MKNSRVLGPGSLARLKRCDANTTDQNATCTMCALEQPRPRTTTKLEASRTHFRTLLFGPKNKNVPTVHQRNAIGTGVDKHDL